VLLLDMSTPQRPEMHLDVPGQQEPMLLLDMSTPQGPDLHLDGFGQQEPMLLLNVSTLQGPKLHLDVMTCLENRNQCWSGRFYTGG
jgi:hypothetical protein